MKAEELPNKLDQAANAFAELFANAPQVASQEVLGSYLQRIFNSGLNTNGTQIGQYVGSGSKSKGRYKAKRNEAGLRIDKVDLQFSGDLFRSIDTGTLGADSVLGFTNTERKQVADHLEKRYGDVFTASKEEQEEAKELMIQYIEEGTSEILKRLF